MSKNGLVVDGEGWFVVNARESRWKNEGPLGAYWRMAAAYKAGFVLNLLSLNDGAQAPTASSATHAPRALRVQTGSCITGCMF